MPNASKVSHLEYQSHGLTAPDLFVCLCGTETDVAISSLRGPQVTILVGTERAKYILPRRLLCENSAFFAAAFLGTFSEANLQSIDLPDADPESFTTIVIDLITDNFRVQVHGNQMATDFVEYRLGLLPIIRVYLVASKVLLPRTQYRAYKEYVRLSESSSSPTATSQLSRSVSPETLLLILDETPETSSLRNLVQEHLWSDLEHGFEHISTYSEVLSEHPALALTLLERYQAKSMAHSITYGSLKERRKKEVAELEARRHGKVSPLAGPSIFDTIAPSTSTTSKDGGLVRSNFASSSLFPSLDQPSSPEASTNGTRSSFSFP